MRIGIDASRAFGEQRTGTENYSYQMIRHILALPEAKNDEFVLYVRTPPAPSLIKEGARGGGVQVEVKQIPQKFLWTQIGLAARTWLDSLDVLWVPAHTLPVLRKPGLKTVVTIHGIEYEWLPAFENVLQRWYLPLSTKYAVAQADRIIAVSEFTKKQLVARLGAEANKIEVVWEGVSPFAFGHPPLNLRGGTKGGDILKKYDLQSKKYLLFIGTVQPRKNLVRLIEAFSRLPGELKLVIAGKPGWGYQEILRAPEKYGVVGRVKFTGYVDDIERDILLANARVYVQPSITEGFGLPVVEAFAAGVPVVASRGGALAEVVGEAGRLFEAESEGEMEGQLRSVIKDARLRGKLIRAGIKRVGEFGWETAAIKTYNILTTRG